MIIYICIYLNMLSAWQIMYHNFFTQKHVCTILFFIRTYEKYEMGAKYLKPD